MHQRKAKNQRIFLILILLLGIGSTLAYYSTTSSFENLFKTGEYGAKAEEVFKSPDDWKPGDETPKTVTVKNTGSICENVRVSYTEEWIAKDGTKLDGMFCARTIEKFLNYYKQPIQATPLSYAKKMGAVCNDPVAIINFDNRNEWIENRGYFYYTKDLLKGETTSSFIKSVTFNPYYKEEMQCTTVTENGKTSEECRSAGDSYSGATYKLTIKIETIQCNAAELEWDLDFGSGEVIITSSPHQLDNVNKIEMYDEKMNLLGEMPEYLHIMTETTSPVSPTSWKENIQAEKLINLSQSNIQTQKVKTTSFSSVYEYLDHLNLTWPDYQNYSEYGFLYWIPDHLFTKQYILLKVHYENGEIKNYLAYLGKYIGDYEVDWDSLPDWISQEEIDFYSNPKWDEYFNPVLRIRETIRLDISTPEISEEDWKNQPDGFNNTLEPILGGYSTK